MKNAIPCHQQGKQGGCEEVVGGTVAVVVLSIGGRLVVSVVTAIDIYYYITCEPY